MGGMTETNARIADQAAELFHQHGITATGVEALSHAAGISKRTLYERFGSKDGLIAAAFDVRDVPVFKMYTAPPSGRDARAISSWRSSTRSRR